MLLFFRYPWLIRSPIVRIARDQSSTDSDHRNQIIHSSTDSDHRNQIIHSLDWSRSEFHLYWSPTIRSCTVLIARDESFADDDHWRSKIMSNLDLRDQVCTPSIAILTTYTALPPSYSTSLYVIFPPSNATSLHSNLIRRPAHNSSAFPSSCDCITSTDLFCTRSRFHSCINAPQFKAASFTHDGSPYPFQ